MRPNYTYRAEWNPEEAQYTAQCLEFPRLYASGDTAQEAVAAMEILVAQVVAEWDDDPPESLTDHLYSGRFMVRTSRSLHAKLMVEATEQRVSFNQWVATKLSGRAPSFDPLFD